VIRFEGQLQGNAIKSASNCSTHERHSMLRLVRLQAAVCRSAFTPFRLFDRSIPLRGITRESCRPMPLALTVPPRSAVIVPPRPTDCPKHGPVQLQKCAGMKVQVLNQVVPPELHEWVLAQA